MLTEDFWNQVNNVIVFLRHPLALTVLPHNVNFLHSFQFSFLCFSCLWILLHYSRLSSYLSWCIIFQTFPISNIINKLQDFGHLVSTSAMSYFCSCCSWCDDVAVLYVFFVLFCLVLYRSKYTFFRTVSCFTVKVLRWWLTAQSLNFTFCISGGRKIPMYNLL